MNSYKPSFHRVVGFVARWSRVGQAVLGGEIKGAGCWGGAGEWVSRGESSNKSKSCLEMLGK